MRMSTFATRGHVVLSEQLATPRLTGGLPLRDVLTVPALAGYEIAAGTNGLDRIVRRMNVMEVPDILPWVKSNELLLTTAYAFRDDPAQLTGLVPALADRELAGLGVKLGRYLDHLPPDLTAVANQLDFPVITLASHVRYDDVLQQTLTRILDHQVSALSVSERVHHTLAGIVLNGGGLPEVAHDVSRALRRAVLVAERTGGVVGSAGFTDTLRLEEARQAIAGLSRSAQATERITGLRPGMRLLTVPIAAGGRADGVIGALELDRPLGDDDLAALRSAALVAALVLHQQSAVRSARHKSAADLLHALIGGRFEHTQDMIRRAAAMGWNITRRLRVMIADADNSSAGNTRDHQRLLFAVATAVRRQDPGGAVVPLATEIVAITSADASGEVVRAAAAGAGVPSIVGVSRIIDGPAQIADAYEQASSAVRIGRRVRGGDASVDFDALGSYRLLSQVASEELQAYATDMLGPLLADDDEARALRATLHMFLGTGGNVAATARRLHFHYNTVRSRLARIESLIGAFTSDPRRQIDLALAMQITTMHELGLSPTT